MAKNIPAPIETEPEPGKGHATPSRKEQEAARKRPLVSADRAEQRRRAQTERDRQRAGMAAGDEKFLPARDKGPQKKFARDYVDARFAIGELLLPIMGLFVVLTFLNIEIVNFAGQIFLLAYFAGSIIDALVAGQIVTRKLGEKYGDRSERVRWYIAMRTFQFRPLRLPKPQVKRGAYPAV